jgi:hypothetical protein
MSSTTASTGRPPIKRAKSLLDKLPDELPSDSTLENAEALRRAEEQAAIQLSKDRNREMQAEQQRQDAGTQQREQEQEEMAHMQLVLKEGLWIGDVYAAQDEKSLKEAGIVSIQPYFHLSLSPC